MLDTYHMNIEEADPYAAVAVAGRRIKHVQVSGTDRGAPGADHFDWPRFFAALGATGYRGAVCIESFTAENETIATAASIWRPLAPSQDRLAQDGLAYLRRDPPVITGVVHSGRCSVCDRHRSRNRRGRSSCRRFSCNGGGEIAPWTYSASRARRRSWPTARW